MASRQPAAARMPERGSAVPVRSRRARRRIRDPGTSAAAESTTSRSTARKSQRAGDLQGLLRRFGLRPAAAARRPRRAKRHRPGSNACSASIQAAVSPTRCARARSAAASVVFPHEAGPKISTMRPRGRPPTPRAESRARKPVGMTAPAAGLGSWRASDESYAGGLLRSTALSLDPGGRNQANNQAHGGGAEMRRKR